MAGNFDLKEEVRDYWSRRSETFHLAFGHRIATGHEAGAVLGPFLFKNGAFSGDMHEYKDLQRRKPHCLPQQLNSL